ncbi:MAG: tRNA lysidine(34) synthetase TilS [Candidatus Makana argininalis]
MNKLNNYILLRNKVINNIKNFKNMLLSFSGGMDSTVLLDILHYMNLNNKYKKKKKINIRAIYIQHNINNNNDIFLNHCYKECKKRDIKFITDKITINNISGGVEASFRKARYNTIYKNMLQNEVLLTAHHMYDQIETLFLSIKRGSGPTGISGISMYSKFNKSFLIRPMINISRDKVNNYALHYNLKWLNDTSNNEIKFDRNFIRLKILPILKRRWPSFYFTSNRSSKLCYFQENLINNLIKEDYNKIIQIDGSIIFVKLLQMNIMKVFALLRKWFINAKIKMPSIKKIYFIWQEIINSKNNSFAKIKIDKNKEVIKFQNRIYINNINIFISKNFLLFWNYKYNLIILPFNLGIIKKSINFICTNYKFNNNLKKLNFKKFNFFQKKKFISIVRPPSINEFMSIRFTCFDKLIYLIGNKHGLLLKTIWKNLNIPIWYRNRIPLLFYNNNLITAPGIFVTNKGLNINCKIKLEITWIKI